MSVRGKRTVAEKPRPAKKSRLVDRASRKTHAESTAAGRHLASFAELLPRWLGPTMIALAGVGMLYWTWGIWPDVLIDFGRELYVPWRLSAGQVLYTDIAYFNGPLSPYWNSVWFRFFGVSLRTLVVSNVLLLLVLTSLLYLILRDIGSRLGATAACLIFIVLFAFGQFLSIGNYNFIAPYSHDLTHGVLLSVIAISAVRLYQRRHRLTFVAMAGLAMGLLYLTKVEVFLAGGVATMVGIGLTLWMERPSRRRLQNAVGVFLAGVATPITVTLALFWLAMPLGHVLREPLAHWLAPARAGVASLPFYQEGLGIDDPAARLQALLMSTFWYVVILGPAALLSLSLRKRRRYRLAVAGVLFAMMAAGLGLMWRDIAWQHAGYPLPLFMLLIVAASLGVLVRRLRRAEVDYPLVLRLSITVFALVLLAKMALNARIDHYGFALAMPATLLLVLALLDWMPAMIDELGGLGAAFRGAAVAVLLVATLAHLSVISEQIHKRAVVVSSGADTFRADGRGLFVTKAIEVLRSRARPDQTLAVLPEGVMINYLDRRVNPTPYTVFIPVEVALFGEDRMLAALQARPPDYVMLVHRPTAEYGLEYFGRDYGRKISAWIATSYQPTTVIGAMPLQDGRFGILLMQRKDTR